VINSQIPSNDSIESLINVDIQSVDFSDVEKVGKLLLKGQAEVKAKARMIVGQRNKKFTYKTISPTKTCKKRWIINLSYERA